MIHPLKRKCDPGLEVFFKNRVERLIPEVLDRYHITYGSMRFDYCRSRIDESNRRHILVVYAQDTNTNAWTTAAKEILSLFFTGEEDELDKDVQVEIQNQDEVCDNYSRPLQQQDRELIDELTQLRDKVSASHQIHLEFLIGHLRLLQERESKPKFLSDLADNPVNGSSLGIEGNTDSAGTLGGWMFLNLPGHAPIKCALTCCHVIRSNDKTVRAHTDKHGVLLNDPRGQVMATFPALLDAEFMRDRLEQYPPDDPLAFRLRGVLSRLKSKPGIGRVILASGYRVQGGRRLDWALIESPDTCSK